MTDTNVESRKEHPGTISEAICAVMADLKRLAKADHNQFASYAFTSVDDFKDAVRPIMAKYGLFHHTTQSGFTLVEMTDEKGKTKSLVQFDFDITLKHINGNAEPPERMTVMLPFTGAQTSGAARSYAIKEWMKSRFLASAGDQQEEADLLDNSREGLRLAKADARKMYEDMTKELREEAKKKDYGAVAEWWKKNKEKLDSLPKDWFLTLKGEYAETWKELKVQADLDKMSNDELDKMTMNGDGSEDNRSPGDPGYQSVLEAG